MNNFTFLQFPSAGPAQPSTSSPHNLHRQQPRPPAIKNSQIKPRQVSHCATFRRFSQRCRRLLRSFGARCRCGVRQAIHNVSEVCCASFFRVKQPKEKLLNDEDDCTTVPRNGKTRVRSVTASPSGTPASCDGALQHGQLL